jgi:preprotein translocase subunit SecG
MSWPEAFFGTVVAICVMLIIVVMMYSGNGDDE